MSKAGKKLIAAVQEAVHVARCDHDLVLISRIERMGGTTTTTECRLCKARFTTYEPVRVCG